MSERLEIALNGRDVSADKMLKAASLTLSILRSLEREISGKRPTILWRVDMMSGHSYGLIAIRGETRTTEKGEGTNLSAVFQRFRETGMMPK